MFKQLCRYLQDHGLASVHSPESIIIGLIKREIELLDDPKRSYVPTDYLCTFSLVELYKKSYAQPFDPSLLKPLIKETIGSVLKYQGQKNSAKESIIWSILQYEEIDKKLRDEVLEELVDKASETGFWEGVFSFFDPESEKKLPSKLEELIVRLTQNFSVLLEAVFDDKSKIHHPLSIWIENRSNMREGTRAGLDNFLKQLEEFIHQIKDKTLTYSNQKMMFKYEKWNYQNAFKLIKKWIPEVASIEPSSLFDTIKEINDQLREITAVLTQLKKSTEKVPILNQLILFNTIEDYFRKLKASNPQIKQISAVQESMTQIFTSLKLITDVAQKQEKFCLLAIKNSAKSIVEGSGKRNALSECIETTRRVITTMKDLINQAFLKEDSKVYRSIISDFKDEPALKQLMEELEFDQREIVNASKNFYLVPIRKRDRKQLLSSLD